MATYDMCTTAYSPANFEARSDLNGRVGVMARRFVGTDFTNLSTTAADIFKVMKISKHQKVSKATVIVVDADDTAIELDVGYTDGTNTAATAFETNAALNATGCTSTSDDIIYFDDDGYYIILTFSALSTLDDATEFILEVQVTDLSNLGIAATLTAPV